MTTPVVLDHLVISTVRTATNNVCSTGTLDRDSIFTHVLEPDKLQVAAPKAVHSLSLVGADDDVLQGGAFFEDEDGIILPLKGLD